MTPLLSSALLATQSDERLLALAAGGHDRAFEAIVERYRRPLSRYLRRVLSAPLAEDVLQATFVNAWRSLERGTQVRDLRPWLYRIAHNQAVNALERAEPRLASQAETDALATTAAGPEAEVEQRDTLQRALTAIADLPDRQRAALVAIAVEDRPHPDVARELGMTEGALRQLVHRARTTLRAAATAVVPLPLVAAVASAGSSTTLAQVAEVAAGAGGAGLGVKTGAALLAAGAIVVGAPAVHEQRAHPGAALHASVAAGSTSPSPVAARAVLSAPAPAPAAQPASRPSSRHRDGSAARGSQRQRRRGRGPGAPGGDVGRGGRRPSREGEDRRGPGSGPGHRDESTGHGGGATVGHEDRHSGPGSGADGQADGHGGGGSTEEVHRRGGSTSGSGAVEDPKHGPTTTQETKETKAPEPAPAASSSGPSDQTTTDATPTTDAAQAVAPAPQP